MSRYYEFLANVYSISMSWFSSNRAGYNSAAETVCTGFNHCNSAADHKTQYYPINYLKKRMSTTNIFLIMIQKEKQTTTVELFCGIKIGDSTLANSIRLFEHLVTERSNVAELDALHAMKQTAGAGFAVIDRVQLKNSMYNIMFAKEW